jgi:energy-coupling factor transporter transmembrane protein EcfT
MIGSIRWNIALGLIGFILTFFVSISNNIFSTTILHSLYSGLILFIVAFIFRWFFGTLFMESPSEKHIGSQLNLITPDETDEIHQLMRGDQEIDREPSEFTPLNPPKLVSKRNLDPEEMVKAIRHMSED